MNERPHQPSAEEADRLESGFAAELVFSIGLGLVVAGVGAFTASTVALVWSSLF